MTWLYLSIAHTNESSDEMQFYYLGKTPEKKSEMKLGLVANRIALHTECA